MNIIRYLSFEISRTCNMIASHADKCPIAHPGRYQFSDSDQELTDDVIVKFWNWCCLNKSFRGIVMWHFYNEPTLHMARILELMRRMKAIDPSQPFQITTNTPGNYPQFDIVNVSDYANAVILDNRIETATGEGKPYMAMPPRGHCGRGLGWEIPIDNFGNWCLCCNDWRCEESVGSIMNGNWEIMYDSWKKKSKRIRWDNESSYDALPRMCRSCFDRNPALHKRGGL